jgi:predicted ribosomally synthesized peptide with nif11-like leader
MPSPDLEQFCSEVLLDPSLQEKLRNTRSTPEFVQRVVETGASRGFEFSAEDVSEAIRAGHRVWLERWI